MSTVPRSRPFSLVIIEGPMTIPMSAMSFSGIWRSVRCGDEYVFHSFEIFTKIPRISHAHGKTLPSFNRERQVLSSNCGSRSHPAHRRH